MSWQVAATIFILAGIVGIRLISQVIEDHMRTALRIRQARNRALARDLAIRRHLTERATEKRRSP